MRASSVLLVLLAALAHPRAMAADGEPPLADPTRPPELARTDGERSAPRPLDVSAVFLSGARPLALVNGRLLAAGDSLGAITVEAVLPEGIRYRTAAGRVLTRLLGRRAALTVKAPPSTPLAARGSPLASTGAHAP